MADHMDLIPTHLERDPEGNLVISWSDGARCICRLQRLRDACPCATCRERRQAPPPTRDLLPVIPLESTRPLNIVAMRPVGNYAYNITFSDGHDTGIFTLELLRSLGEPA